MLDDLQRKLFQQNLIGERIRLAKNHPALTASLWQSILRDRKVRGTSWRWVESQDQLQDYLDESAGDIPKKEVVYMIQRDQLVIGTFHIHSLNYMDHKVEVGYAIEKHHEGFGYVSESLRLVETELKRLGFNKVIINCNVENLRSLRLAERNGYLREGTLKQDCIENGKFRDSAVFGKIL